ncbi:hypothetical protein PR048_005776, partial [Dryococelus australis]
MQLLRSSSHLADDTSNLLHKRGKIYSCMTPVVTQFGIVLKEEKLKDNNVLLGKNFGKTLKDSKYVGLYNNLVQRTLSANNADDDSELRLILKALTYLCK